MSIWENYPQLENDLIKVESFMKANVVSRKKIVTNISIDLIEAGGKRLRPAFVILAAKCGKKYNEDIIISLAAAVELIHTATLVHDDIIDEAKYRRGKESVQNKWGKDMAVYIGDYLLSTAFNILSDKTTITRLKEISSAVTDICEGEIDQYESRYKISSSYSYIKKVTRKTAVLFMLCFSAGAYESNCDKKTIDALTKFGLNFGIAFQIRDDLLDYISQDSIIGKPVGNDVKQGYYTLPLLKAVKDKKYGNKIKELLSKEENITDEELVKIYNYVKETNSIEETKELLTKYHNKCKSYLKNIKNKEVVDILNTLIEYSTL